MAEKIDLGTPRIGFPMTSARKGEFVEVRYREFTSTEDGQYFIKRLEGISNEILRQLQSNVLPSQVDHLLAICYRDGTADVYLNELEFKGHARPARPVEAGQDLSKDDIADIESLEVGVPIPDEAGYLFLFSVGWRKGLCYDFGPSGLPNPVPRQYDVGVFLAQCYAHLTFQERFSISDPEWETLFQSQWFPFVGMGDSGINRLISHIRSGWDPDELLEEITTEVRARIPGMEEGWQKLSPFQPHLRILERAVERFQAEDYVSCTGLLFPRIEGILRTHQSNLSTPTSNKPNNLSKSAVSSKIGNDKSLLLPHRFLEYLNDIYFAHFNPQSPSIDVSRHSVGHGVADQYKFDQKSAVIGILSVNQLSYFLAS